jgi:hypothetical protein
LCFISGFFDINASSPVVFGLKLFVEFGQLRLSDQRFIPPLQHQEHFQLANRNLHSIWDLVRAGSERKQRGTAMAKDEHNKAAEHHENAAKAHRTAAEHHGKGDHGKGKEHAATAKQHSQTANQHSDQAHSKSQQQK